MREMKAGSEWNAAARSLAAALAFAWACVIGVSLVNAQETASAHEPEPVARLLTAAEGRAVVNAAWELDMPARKTQDCSHLVHQIYANAGFEYPYASSFEIYAGDESFERVRNPQSGDLVVWPGHVGIVVSPRHHTFFSALSHGPGTAKYDERYWRRRGPARFYRYLKSDQSAAILNPDR